MRFKAPTATSKSPALRNARSTGRAPEDRGWEAHTHELRYPADVPVRSRNVLPRSNGDLIQSLRA
ncbi:MAG: hypothetical protein AVDCRST_MAG22-2822 [uncultured Rubrobacteraceae bacterium]|uniref:Uncharacterized protein n=1 Tax=uncultured Rubrobacteraceae bacterium TaxID=349277 RepID=A0A6J4Q0I9_9ACTN|nr:MAG: hypothetical protein AVDCRST_MAG22-2822 [uncultured Rubrobacteraceae bacterium]